MKALALLKSRKATSDRAAQYAAAIKSDLEFEVLRTLQKKKEAIENKIYDLEDFDLETNLNAGRTAMTQEAAKKRFVELIELRYELTEVTLELEVKTEAFNIYFGTEETTANENK